MITLANKAKAPAEILRLTKLNEEAETRIIKLRAKYANEKQIRNTRAGITMREATINELKAWIK